MDSTRRGGLTGLGQHKIHIPWGQIKIIPKDMLLVNKLNKLMRLWDVFLFWMINDVVMVYNQCSGCCLFFSGIIVSNRTDLAT